MRGWRLLRWVFVWVGVVGLARGDQHVLLDTTKEAMLDWTRYPYGPNSPTPGWVEESFTNFEKGINWRSYVVCDVGYSNVNNWLWTPFITRHDAQRIYIEVKFSLRNCDLFPGTALQCKETFSLLYYEFDAATREPPPWEPESYKQIDVIAADEGRFTNSNEVIINTETRSVEVHKKGIYFAFRDQGACLSLLAVKVYYLKCPEVTVGFAHYPETATGSQLSSIQKVPGRCVDNAVARQVPHNLCKADGSWNFHTGACECMAGHEPAGEDENQCTPCRIGYYKPQPGQARCELCPAHSRSLYEASVECRCNDGFYRARDDGEKRPCTRPPQAPQGATYHTFANGSVQLEWQPPADEGARTDTSYEVRCTNCGEGGRPPPSFQPNRFPIAQTSVLVYGLQPGQSYTFAIRALNGVSDLTNTSLSSASLNVVLGQSGSESMVQNIRVLRQEPNKLLLSWEAPPSASSLDDEVYEIRYSRADGSDNETLSLITKRDQAEIGDLIDHVTYKFQIRAQTAKGWGDFSPAMSITTDGASGGANSILVSEKSESFSKSEMTVIILSVILIFTILLVVSIGFCRRQLKVSGSGKKDSDTLKYHGVDNGFVTESFPIVQTQLALDYNPFSHNKTYIDPHTYEDPNKAVQQFAKEIDSKFITIEAIIGGGEFGDVCRGRLSIPERTDLLVAIKTLKPGGAEKAKMDFLAEASIMGQFEHPNVIFLQGVVTKANPIMIITEYMENGSLDTFLRANDGKFQVMQLVGMMRGIAYGMQYLAEMNYVHRDLAARNVLVNSQLVCKIADFGLSRELVEDNFDGAYTTRGGKIPVRWTAPEAIAFRKFTSSSDVWSFGIVMWEVMSYGERPYWTWSNQDVIKAIERGYRLPAPMDCPEAIHQLMLDSWQKDRSHRPSFSSIVKTLDKLICSPETLTKLSSSSTSPLNHYHALTANPRTFASIDEWLESLKMTRYSTNFHNFNVTEMSQVAQLTLQDIVNLGITLVGHQKKIMSSIQSMRTGDRKSVV